MLATAVYKRQSICVTDLRDAPSVHHPQVIVRVDLVTCEHACRVHMSGSSSYSLDSPGSAVRCLHHHHNSWWPPLLTHPPRLDHVQVELWSACQRLVFQSAGRVLFGEAFFARHGLDAVQHEFLTFEENFEVTQHWLAFHN